MKNKKPNHNYIPILLDLMQLVEQVISHEASMVDRLVEDSQCQVLVMEERIQYSVEESYI
jgi:hypothetical protein